MQLVQYLNNRKSFYSLHSAYFPLCGKWTPAGTQTPFYLMEPAWHRWEGEGGRDVLHDFPACRFVTDTLRLNPGLTAPGGPLKQRLRGIKSEWCEQMRRTVTWLATRDVWWMDRAAVWMGRLNWAVWPGGAHQSGAAPEVSAEAVQWCEQHVPRPPVASQVWGSALSKLSSPPRRRSYHPSRGPEPRHATHFC